MNLKPTVSIVLCTYNNAESLKITLNQLLNQDVIQNGRVEVIVVNNNATDDTENVCRKASEVSTLPFTYAFETRQGISHARNAGVNLASGDYILFTDDDAELPPNWISAYLNEIDRHQADCLYSSIHVIWDKPRPWWYQNVYRPCFVELNYGETSLNITDIHHEFFGKNFCVKKQVIVDQGGFDPALGRIGSKLIAGEETLLYRNLVRSNRKIIYFPDAPIGHRLKAKEYTEPHIEKLFVDGAYSDLQIARVSINKKIGKRPLGLLNSSIKSLLKSSVGFVINSISGNRRQRFYYTLCIKKNLQIISLWINMND